MADPKKSYNDILTWAKGTSNDIIAKQLATARTISITNNSGTTLASGTFNGTGNLTLKLPETVGIHISGNAATATKLGTARTLSFTGAFSGSGSFDGSTDLSISTTSGITVPVGAVLPFLGTEYMLPINFQKCSGQTLTKASYPELFAVFVSTGLASSSDTSFIVPDLRRRYLKGSTRNDDAGYIGRMLREKLPDIQGTIDMRHNTNVYLEAFGETYDPTLTGAFSDSDKTRIHRGTADGSGNSDRQLGCIDFKASNYDPIYGRSYQKGDGNETVIPYSCVVNWVIRVK